MHRFVKDQSHSFHRGSLGGAQDQAQHLDTVRPQLEPQAFREYLQEGFGTGVSGDQGAWGSALGFDWANRSAEQLFH
jgi:hypothetical protein